MRLHSIERIEPILQERSSDLAAVPRRGPKASGGISNPADVRVELRGLPQRQSLAGFFDGANDGEALDPTHHPHLRAPLLELRQSLDSYCSGGCARPRAASGQRHHVPTGAISQGRLRQLSRPTTA